MKKLIFESDVVEISYEPELKLAKVVWKKKAETEEYRATFMKVLEYSRANPVDNFLSDIRNQGVVSPDNRKWFEAEMLPKAIKAGLKRAGSIFDGNVFKKYYMNMIIKVSGKFGLPLKLFSTEEEAIEWFKSFEQE
jgi:hypothetical protein